MSGKRTAIGRHLRGLIACGIVLGAYASARHLLRAYDIHVYPVTDFDTESGMRKRTTRKLAWIYNVEDSWPAIACADDDNGANNGADTAAAIRVLRIGGAIQGAAWLDERWCETPFAYYKLYDRAFEARLDIRRVCMIGGGGYTYPRYLIAHHPDVLLDVVEIDGTVTALAKRYFFLERLQEEYGTQRLGLIEADGRTWLDKLARDCSAVHYDAIMNDAFSGKTYAHRLATVQAAEAVSACLSEGGVYLSNVVGTLSGKDSDFVRAEIATLAQVFAHVYVLACPGNVCPEDPDNIMLIATNGDHMFHEAQEMHARPSDPILRDETAHK